MGRTLSLAGLLVGLLANCRLLAPTTAPDKQPSESTSPGAQAAIDGFWKALEAGRYEEIPDIQAKLNAAYSENPQHSDVSLLLAHTHLWRISEVARAGEPPPAIAEDALLAATYFRAAKRLRPQDHRIYGWLGPVTMALGNIHNDEERRREGYRLLLEGVDKDPIFNSFSASVSLSRHPSRHEMYAQGLAFLWDGLARCMEDGVVDRNDPDLQKYLRSAVSSGPRRFCFNLPRAPHNIEGFFLHMGDVLVKSGDAKLARRVYAFAKNSPDYAEWPFRSVIENRLEKVELLARLYTDADESNDPPVMMTSAISCTACHQQDQPSAAHLQALRPYTHPQQGSGITE